ncbi:protein FAM110B-like [Leucoraja erinacea]|uniref:protein FAM110B-like n=1 Tax=Leucoraja erinaceus TaxID=7782 RepID=UPI00245511E8|nr:protein FAM110B-like [Leucoraja erinacea]
MPSEIAPTASMPPEASISLALRLMCKGPGYFRSQMEGDRRSWQSAVERLAADKVKYLKSQTARGAKWSPMLQEAAQARLAGHVPAEVRVFVRGAAVTSSAHSFKGSDSLVSWLLPGSSGWGDKKQRLATGAATSEGGELAEDTEVAAPQGSQITTPAAFQEELAVSPVTPQGAQVTTPAAPQEAPVTRPAASQGAQVTMPEAPREAASGRPKEPLKRRVGEGGLWRSHSDLSCRFSRACSGLVSFF